jgi:hypothetical protein
MEERSGDSMKEGSPTSRAVAKVLWIIALILASVLVYLSYFEAWYFTAGWDGFATEKTVVVSRVVVPKAVGDSFLFIDNFGAVYAFTDEPPALADVRNTFELPIPGDEGVFCFTLRGKEIVGSRKGTCN